MDKGKVGYLYYGHVGHAEAGQPLNCDFFSILACFSSSDSNENKNSLCILSAYLLSTVRVFLLHNNWYMRCPGYF